MSTLRACFARRDFEPLVHTFMSQHGLQRQALQAAMRWQPGAYTRNSLHREDRFEVLLLCWDFHAVSPVHDHGGQRCWAQVVSGTLSVETFERLNPQQSRPTGTGIWTAATPDKRRLWAGDIDFRGLAAPAHRVGNEGGPHKRAISLHVYARPLRECVIYDPHTGCAQRQAL